MYNISQLQEALLRADAVGDVESARLFAAEIQELQQPAPQPEQTPLDLEPYLESLQGYEDASRTAFGRGLRSGLNTMEQFYGSATEGIGRSLGLEGLQEYGAEIALANEADVQRAAKNMTPWEDVNDLSSFLTHLGELGGQTAPITAGAIGATALGTLAAPAVGLTGAAATVAGLGAGLAPTIPFFYGGNRERQINESGGDREFVNEGAAFVASIPQALAEVIVDKLLVGGKFFTPKALQGGGIFTKKTVGRVGLGAAEGSAAEGVTELGQAVIERAQAGLPLDSEEAHAEYAEAARSGALIGGAISGPVGGVRGSRTPASETVAPITLEEALSLKKTTTTPTTPTTTTTPIEETKEVPLYLDKPIAELEAEAKKVSQLNALVNETLSSEKALKEVADRNEQPIEELRQELKNTRDANLARLNDLNEYLKSPMAEEKRRQEAKGEPDATGSIETPSGSSVPIDPRKPRTQTDEDTTGVGAPKSETVAETEVQSKPVDDRESDVAGTLKRKPIKIIRPQDNIELSTQAIKEGEDIGPINRKALEEFDALDNVEDSPEIAAEEEEISSTVIDRGEGRTPLRIIRPDEALGPLSEQAKREAATPIVPEVVPEVVPEAEAEATSNTQKMYDGKYLHFKTFRDKNGKLQSDRYLIEQNPKTKRWVITPDGSPIAAASASSLGEAKKLINGFSTPEAAETTADADLSAAEDAFAKVDAVQAETKVEVKVEPKKAAPAKKTKAKVETKKVEPKKVTIKAAPTPAEEFTAPVTKAQMNDANANREVVRKRYEPLIKNADSETKKDLIKARDKELKSWLTGEAQVKRAKDKEKRDVASAAVDEQGARQETAKINKTLKDAELENETADIGAKQTEDAKLASKRLNDSFLAGWEKRTSQEDKDFRAKNWGVYDEDKGVLYEIPYNRGGLTYDPTTVIDKQKILRFLSEKPQANYSTGKKTKAGKPGRRVNPDYRVWVRFNQARYPFEALLEAADEIAGRTRAPNENETKSKAETKYYRGRSAKEALNFKRWVDANLSEKTKTWLEGKIITEKKLVYRINNTNTLSVEQNNRIDLDNQFNLNNADDGKLKLSQEAIHRLALPLSRPVKRMLDSGDLDNALRTLAFTTENKEISALASKLRKYAGDTKVIIVKNLKDAGSFDPRTNTIRLSAQSGLNAHVLLHEMSHAALSATLANPSHPTTKQLQTIFNGTKELLDTAYGSTDLQEFGAEFMSNGEFRRQLGSIHINGEATSVLRRVKNVVGNFLRRLAGVQPIDIAYLPNLSSEVTNMNGFEAISLLINGNSMFESVLAPAPGFRDGETHAYSATKVVDAIQKDLSKKFSPEGKQAFKDQSKELWTEGVQGNVQKGLLKAKDLLSLGETARDAGFGEFGMDMDRLVKEQRGAMEESDIRVQKVVKEVQAWAKKAVDSVTNTRAEDALDRVIYNLDYGSTVHQVDPTISVDNYTKFWLRNKDTGRRESFKTAKARNARLTKLNNVANKGRSKNIPKVTPFVKDGDADADKVAIWQAQRADWELLQRTNGDTIYTKMRNLYIEMFNDLIKVLFDRIDVAFEGNPRAAASLKNIVYEKLFQKLLKVYFPYVREGKYKLSYSLKTEERTSPEDSYVVRMFTTREERDRATVQAKEDVTVDRSSVETTDGELTASKVRQAAPPMAFVGQVLKIIEQNVPSSTSAERKLSDDLQTEILDVMIRLLPENSFAKSLMTRKGYIGFKETQAIDSMRNKAYDLGRQTARLKFGAKISALEDKISEVKQPETTPKRSFVGKVAAWSGGSFELMKKELIDRGRFARNPPKDAFEGVVKRLNQGAFIYTIGFNGSSAIVNLSQLPLVVYPYLAGRYGGIEAFAQMNLGSRLTVASRNDLRSLYDASKDGVFTLKKDLKLSPKLTEEYEELTPLVSMAAKQGALTTSFIEDSLGLNEASRQGTDFWDKVSSVSAIFFQQGERFNRQTTLVATYKLELKRLNGEIKTRTAAETAMTPQEKQEAAAEWSLIQTQKTNSGATLETGPALARQGALRVAMMYKTFGLRMYHTMLASAKDVFDKNLNSTERVIAFKQLLAISGTSTLIAGVHGFPLYGAVSVIANAFLGEDDDDFDTMVRKNLGEGFYKGGLAMTGIDVSNRIRLTGLLLQENKYNSGASMADSAFFYAGGPAISSIQRVGRGFNYLFDGEMYRGFENIMPAGLANAFKAFPGIGRLSAEGGYKTKRQDPIYTDVSPFEQFGQFFGFAPTNYTRIQEQNNIIKGIDTTVNKKRSGLLKKYYVSKRLGDYYGVQKIKEEMQKFNSDHPTAKITPETIDRSMKQHARSSKDIKKYNGVQISKLLQKELDMSIAEWDNGLTLFD